jgi:hypothetical protein
MRFAALSFGDPRLTTLADGSLLFTLDSANEVVLAKGTPRESRFPAPCPLSSYRVSPSQTIM